MRNILLLGTLCIAVILVAIFVLLESRQATSTTSGVWQPATQPTIITAPADITPTRQANSILAPQVTATEGPTEQLTTTPELPATARAPKPTELATWKDTGRQVISDLSLLAKRRTLKGTYSPKVRAQMTAILRGPAPHTLASGERAHQPPNITITRAELHPMNWQASGVYRQNTAQLLDPQKWRSVTVNLSGTVTMTSEGRTVNSVVYPNWNQLTLILHKVRGQWRVYTVSDGYMLRTPDLGTPDPRNYKPQYQQEGTK